MGTGVQGNVGDDWSVASRSTSLSSPSAKECPVKRSGRQNLTSIEEVRESGRMTGKNGGERMVESADHADR